MDAERLLLGPGPSPVADRVMRAMARPVLSHLDPSTMAALDGIRARLGRVFQAEPDAFSLAISGTGTSGMEAAVANLAADGMRALVVVGGYFGDRLAQMLERYGASVDRVGVEWGRACDPAQVERALAGARYDLVGVVHGETSTGVVNPVREIAALARRHDALTIVDAVTSLGAVPVDVAGWQVDVCYSCSQKGLGAPSGMAPLTFSPRALQRRTRSRSFYLDLALLEDYWLRRRYHHTLSSPLAMALLEALTMVEEEGLEARWVRHRRAHEALLQGLERIGLSLLAPPSERLLNLNAVLVPAGVDEGAVRRMLLDEHGIEIGAGLGPLAGRIWRVGLMGSGADVAIVRTFLDAFEKCLRAAGYADPAPQRS